MKNLKYCLTVAGLFCYIFYSCQSEQSAAERITGLWNFQTMEIFDCLDQDLNKIQNFGNASCQEMDGKINCLNGTANFINGNVTYTFNYLIDGILDEQVIEMGTYNFSNSNDTEITICFGAECMVGIVSISDSSLTFNYIDNDCNHSFSAFK